MRVDLKQFRCKALQTCVKIHQRVQQFGRRPTGQEGNTAKLSQIQFRVRLLGLPYHLPIRWGGQVNSPFKVFVCNSEAKIEVATPLCALSQLTSPPHTVQLIFQLFKKADMWPQAPFSKQKRQKN